MSEAEHAKQGRVYIVGAGPGAAGLITVRGVECLQRADVVFYESAVEPRLLSYVSEGAERICLDDSAGSISGSAAAMTEQFAELAAAGRTVVQLSQGDGTLFGGRAAETAALADRGIACEIVPGVPAAVVAASHAGVPLTCDSPGVALLGGPASGEEQDGETDWRRLAQFPGNFVVSGAFDEAKHVARRLMAAGLSPRTPARIIQHCSRPTQVSVYSTLAQLRTQGAPIEADQGPVLVVIGPGARRGGVANWFAQRPLFGQTVLVTRPAGQARSLASPLEEAGAQVLVEPAIEVRHPADWGPADRALFRLADFHWLVFSSVNGVNAFMSRLWATGRDPRALGTVKLAAIGPATAAALEAYHLQVDRCPSRYQAEYLAEALLGDAAGKRYLLVRASRGRELLARELRNAGAAVEQAVFYESLDRPVASPSMRGAMAESKIPWTTVTSSAIARSLVGMFGEDLRHTALVSISPVTSNTLRRLGFEPSVEARSATMEGVVQAILEAVDAGSPDHQS